MGPSDFFSLTKKKSNRDAEPSGDDDHTQKERENGQMVARPIYTRTAIVGQCRKTRAYLRAMCAMCEDVVGLGRGKGRGESAVLGGGALGRTSFPCRRSTLPRTTVECAHARRHLAIGTGDAQPHAQEK
ncbi:hypothetical protein [Pandoravirus japonicus]|uniref:Uncharacterized protein n=1 Tax=Pandoravirus japonicus TaxID=2823154 RepID=A0A811BNF5_9VIRU|nr:hypothetical protein [Pandoravirus japonicus]